MNKPLQQGLLAIVVLAAIVFGFSFYQASEQPSDHLRLWFFDIGQGDSIMIDTPNHQQILVDGGPNSSILQQLGKALPLTDKEIDLVISTHNDADHLAGLNSVLEHYKVDKIWLTGAIHTTQTYQKFRQLIEEKNIPTEIVKAGAKIQFDSLSGVVISPFESYNGLLPDAQNASGIVTFWQYGAETILLTADVDSDQEAEMIDKNVLQPTTILKVAHHGSKTSTSEDFLRVVQPKIAVISVGRNNRYGHPTEETLARLNKFLIPTLRTDQRRTIRFDITENQFSYKTNL